MKRNYLTFFIYKNPQIYGIALTMWKHKYRRGREETLWGGSGGEGSRPGGSCTIGTKGLGILLNKRSVPYFPQFFSAFAVFFS